MKKITDVFGINRSVPFIDVAVDADNRIFVDPHAIRVLPQPDSHAIAALDCLDTFFGSVASCAMSTTASDRRRGVALLQRFTEPWETRLGMSADGFRGHGGSHEVGTWIWDALTTDLAALLTVGVLAQLEDLPLFVEGVDRDITSDITTRIIFAALAAFTQEVLADYPEFSTGGHTLVTVERQIWDPALREWNMVQMELPQVDGDPLLLVPSNWARHNLLMSAKRFYETTVLSFAQDEQAVVTSRGKVSRTRKDLLKRQPALKRGRVTNLNVTRRAVANSQDLIEMFKLFVARKLADEKLRDQAG
ncbi:hypothetical protein KXR83_11355 [Williamsia muralis]|uniref:hypothetical protein n=1 Tax=Williamsia marianensis TaxID=85044 RepID=UPI003F17D8D1